MQRLLNPEMTSAELQTIIQNASEADLRAELALIAKLHAAKDQQIEKLAEEKKSAKVKSTKIDRALKGCKDKLKQNPNNQPIITQQKISKEDKTINNEILRMNNAMRMLLQRERLDLSILKQMIEKKLANAPVVAKAPALDDIEQALVNGEQAIIANLETDIASIEQPLLDQTIHQTKTDAHANFVAALNKHEKDHPRQMINAGTRVALQFANDKSDLARDILVSAKNMLEDNSPANRAHYENLINTPEVPRKKTGSGVVVSILLAFLGAAMVAAGIALCILLIGLPVFAPLFAIAAAGIVGGAAVIAASVALAKDSIYTKNEAALVNLGEKAKPGFFNRSQPKTGAGWVNLEYTAVPTKFSF